MTAVSALLGVVALQPARSGNRKNAVMIARTALGMPSLHNVQREHHASMPLPAKYGTMANEGSGFVRRERQLRGVVLVNLGLETKLPDLEPMCRILASQHKHDRFAFFQRDLARIVLKPLGDYFNAPRSNLCWGNGNKQLHGPEHREQNCGQYVLQLHLEILDLEVASQAMCGRLRSASPGIAGCKLV
jgi:hypothetical protein